MRDQQTKRSALAAAPAVLAGTAAVAADQPEVDPAAVDEAFEALKTYDWGTEPKTLAAIDQAVVASRGDAAARVALEKRLVASLDGASRSAEDYICRALRTIGTDACVPALAALLPKADHSHMARYALERIPAPEAAAALRDALPELDGELKVGVIGSLGARRDQASVAPLGSLLSDSSTAVASAAALALGRIGSPAAGKVLRKGAGKASGEVKPAMANAALVCAERLLADGKRAEAKSLYESLNREDQPKAVRLAAMRGILAASGEK